MATMIGTRSFSVKVEIEDVELLSLGCILNSPGTGALPSFAHLFFRTAKLFLTEYTEE